MYMSRCSENPYVYEIGDIWERVVQVLPILRPKEFDRSTFGCEPLLFMLRNQEYGRYYCLRQWLRDNIGRG